MKAGESSCASPVTRLDLGHTARLPLRRSFGVVLVTMLLTHLLLSSELVAVAHGATNATIYIDSDTVSRNGEMVELWRLAKRPCGTLQAEIILTP